VITRSRIAVPLIVVLLLSGLAGVQATTATPAAAAPVTDFDPGLIISDALMYDSSTMSAGDIQAFLNSKGASCAAGAGYTCIKNYGETTPTRAADALCSGAYVGGTNESAASIIAKVSSACGINPQVLLVTLQKEQGLITATAGKTAATYSRALGFGCPDNAGGACNPSYAGFANQVYSAAKQLKRYASNPTGYSYRAGRTNTILWHPNTSCGSSQVYIQNQATASLYNYTPYRPNAAALAAGYGSGDACSSYGNRNFHLYFTSWFGSAQQRSPLGAIDVVQTIDTSTVQIAGWAFDPDVTNSIDVHIYVDGVANRAIRADGSRPDVAAAYGRGASSGYQTALTLGSGAHDVCIYAIDANGGDNALLGCRSVNVANHDPVGSFDLARAVGPDTIQVTGWAFDPDSPTSTEVHIYIDGQAALAAKATKDRPDVGALYGRNSLVGFDSLFRVSSGSHSVCVYSIDTSGGTNVLLGCRTVSVRNQAPNATFDLVRPAGPGTVQIRGWAYDPDTFDSIDVHVYVDGHYLQPLRADAPRPDVSAVFGVGPNHGFDSLVKLTAGTRSVCLYALDSTGGVNPHMGCQTVAVENTPAQGALESSTTTAASAGGAPSTVTATGWAWDFDTSTPVTARLLVDGMVTTAEIASAKHAVVQGVSSTAIGFTLTGNAAPGQRKVCVEVLDQPTAKYLSIGCKDDVEVPNAAPVAVIDAVVGHAATSTSPARIEARGWALDFDTRAPIDVHFYVDGIATTAAVANLSRPDVDVAYGNGPDHGYSVSIPTSPGTHDACTINVPTGTNALIESRCVKVSVP